MPTTSNFGWTTPADTDLVKDGAAAIRTLGNGIDTSFLDLKGGTTGQVLSKASNTDLDFSWVAQDDSNAIQNALLTTTGDTIYASAASTPARLGLGTAGQVLTVNSGATAPEWKTPAGGGKVLQVVQGTTSTQTAITTQSMSDTGITASITPSSASSKVLVIISASIMVSRTSTTEIYSGAQLLRGATQIADYGSTNRNGSVMNRVTTVTATIQGGGQYSFVYLDSPSTTSSTTYKLQAGVEQNSNSGTVFYQINSALSTIQLLEIGA
jgi:hypothetical protein